MTLISTGRDPGCQGSEGLEAHAVSAILYVWQHAMASTSRPPSSHEQGGTRRRKRLWHHQAHRGPGVAEDALIMALVALVVSAMLVLMGPQPGALLSTMTNGHKTRCC